MKGKKMHLDRVPGVSETARILEVGKGEGWFRVRFEDGTEETVHSADPRIIDITN